MSTLFFFIGMLESSSSLTIWLPIVLYLCTVFNGIVLNRIDKVGKAFTFFAVITIKSQRHFVASKLREVNDLRNFKGFPILTIPGTSFLRKLNPSIVREEGFAE